jgi:hypothetical protein
MQLRVDLRASVLAFAASSLLAACARHPNPTPPLPAPTVPTPAAPVALSQRDLGASMLAAVDNARQAIALHDAIAAGNDVGQARGFARQMIDAGPTVLASSPPRPQSPSSARALAVPLTPWLRSFAVRVRLISAQALLNQGNLAGADAQLSTVQALVPRSLLPQDLPLLRAAASLVLARRAASMGLPQLRTQLLSAVAALRAYAGPAHGEAAMALASMLGQVLSNPTRLQTLLPYQVSLWLARITEWAGSDRW